MKLHAKVILFCLSITFGSSTPIHSNNQCSTTWLASSVNDFGSGLVEEIDSSGNLFISPFSIYTALAMVYLGSSGRTAEQMQVALRSQGVEPSQFHNALRETLQVIKQGNDQYSLLVANGLFAQQNFSINQKYISDVDNFYSAAVKLVDFLLKGESAKNEINKWVADNTQNKIQNFVQEPLHPTTKLALMNAVYFKGIWKKQFDRRSTVDGVFYGPSETTKKVKYMVLHDVAFRFFEDSANKFIELPYKGEHIKMLITLPREQEDPLNFQMNSETLCRIRSSMANVTLQSVIIPRFKVQYRADLNKALVGLGIKDLFNPSADLSGIRTEKDLFVSKVQHEAILEVNEEGSEAVAVTGVYITRLSINLKPEFIANHPFLVHIIDSRNGLVLFCGKIVDP